MKKEEFLNKRQSLLTDAQNLLNDGKAEESNAKMAEVEALDKAYDEEIKAQANLNRLQNSNAMTNPFDKSDKVITPENKIKYEDVFAKYLKGEELNGTETKCFSEFNNATVTKTNNGAVIPEIVLKQIFEKMAERHAVLSEVEMLHVKGNLTLPVATFTDNTNFYDEATDTTDSAVTTAEINLYGYDLKANITISFNLKEMATGEFLNYIVNKIAVKMADKLAYAVVNGLGVPTNSQTHKAQPLGVVTALEAESSTPQVVTYGKNDTNAVLEGKIRNAIAKVPSGYKVKMYAKRATIMNFLLGIKDENGRQYAVVDYTKGGGYSFLGVDVMEEDAIPENAVLIGDFSQGYVVNFNKDITVLQQDQNRHAKTDITGYAIVDGKPVMTEAFAYLKKS